MQTMNMAFPVADGQEPALRALAAELNGPRKSDFDSFLRRLNVIEERWYLQTIGGIPHCIMYLAADNLGEAFGALAVSKHPFDMWMKDQNKTVFNIDFEAPSDAPMPETLLEHTLKAKELV